MNRTSTYNLFKKYAVEANSLEEFLEKHTKHSRHAGRGSEYVAIRIASHQEDIDKYGFTFITHHDSKSGEIVAYYPSIADCPGLAGINAGPKGAVRTP
jgi:hypothetical protein